MLVTCWFSVKRVNCVCWKAGHLQWPARGPGQFCCCWLIGAVSFMYACSQMQHWKRPKDTLNCYWLMPISLLITRTSYDKSISLLITRASYVWYISEGGTNESVAGVGRAPGSQVPQFFTWIPCFAFKSQIAFELHFVHTCKLFGCLTHGILLFFYGISHAKEMAPKGESQGGMTFSLRSLRWRFISFNMLVHFSVLKNFVPWVSLLGPGNIFTIIG